MKHFSPIKTGSYLFLLGLIPFLVFAQTAGAETKAGDIEINTQFSFSNLNVDDVDDDLNILTWSGRVGYFFTDAMAGEGSLVLVRPSFGDATITALQIDARVNYHFLTSGMIIPYVGPAFGLTHTRIEADGFDESDTGVQFGGQVGAKSFLTENVALTTEFNFRRSAGLEADYTQLTVFAGISYFWR